MKLLLIGNQQELDFISHVVYDPTWISTVVFWEDCARNNTLTHALHTSYDYLILGFSNKTMSCHIARFLTEEHQVNPSVMINFYAIYYALVPMMKVDRVMKNPLFPSYEGIILGLSHSQMGILPDAMNKPFANLSVSSQDLYYDLKVLEHCIANYPEKIRHLNYIMIDMLDYSYFNYDISLGRIAYSYYFWRNNGFILDGHNFARNKNFPFSFDEMIIDISQKYYEGTDINSIQLYGKLFNDAHKYSGYKDYISDYEKNYLRTNIITDEDIANFALKSSIVQTVHEDTIKENIDIFYRLLETIYKLNPDMKVLLLIIPRYIEIQKKTIDAYCRWKDMFYEQIIEANRQYPFTFLDLNDHEIATKRLYYHDLCHLNHFGAMKLTAYLNELLFH